MRVLVCAPEASDLGRVPANAVVRPFVPHALVLPGAALTVTHCGHGTVTASLLHGVPLLGMPNLAADQPFLARRVQELGAGLALPSEAPDAIRAASRQVLGQPSYAAAARGLAAAIAASPRAAGAAVALEQVLAGPGGDSA